MVEWLEMFVHFPLKNPLLGSIISGLEKHIELQQQEDLSKKLILV